MRSTVFWSLHGNARTTAPTARATTPPQALETSTSSFHSQALPINFLFLTSHVHHAPDPRKTYARVSPSLGSLAVPRSASLPSLPIITALPARQPKRPGASSTSHLPHTLPSLHLILVEIAIQPSRWAASFVPSLRSCLHIRVIMLSSPWYKADARSFSHAIHILVDPLHAWLQSNRSLGAAACYGMARMAFVSSHPPA